jgi:hypothetical protein
VAVSTERRLLVFDQITKAIRYDSPTPMAAYALHLTADGNGLAVVNPIGTVYFVRLPAASGK